MINSTLTLLVFMFVGALTCYSQESENNPGPTPLLRVEVATVSGMLDQTPKTLFAVGIDIYALVSITNNSSEELNMASGHPWRQFNVKLIKDGEVVPFKKSVSEFLTPSPDKPYGGSIAAFTLKPNASTKELVHVSEWYESLPPGHYQLTLGRIWGRAYTAQPVEFDIYQ
jgi:hypothetical protein